jgi:hypothetical protein
MCAVSTLSLFGVGIVFATNPNADTIRSRASCAVIACVKLSANNVCSWALVRIVSAIRAPQDQDHAVRAWTAQDRTQQVSAASATAPTRRKAEHADSERRISTLAACPGIRQNATLAAANAVPAGLSGVTYGSTGATAAPKTGQKTPWASLASPAAAIGIAGQAQDGRSTRPANWGRECQAGPAAAATAKKEGAIPNVGVAACKRGGRTPGTHS